MVKPLSEQLADLSARAKTAEDHVTAAQREAHDRVIARRDETRSAVEQAINKVDQDLKSLGDTAADRWNSLKAKINSDLDTLKSDIAERRHDRQVRRAEDQADALEWEAALAVDYAVASIEQAELAVYDAILGRTQADQTRAS
jgi:ElaB/YqjD/DUF883 family membrane-anchored ribosome-binding protein